MEREPGSFAIKAEIQDLGAETFTFTAQKTMYGGKRVSAGDRIFLFASENEGGKGLFARGVVTSSAAVPRTTAERQTPRVSITVERRDFAKRPFGRAEVRGSRDWSDGAPETEINFKLYRQATNKIVGLTKSANDLLDRLF